MLDEFEKRHLEEYRTILIRMGKKLEDGNAIAKEKRETVNSINKEKKILIVRMKIINDLMKELEAKQ